MVCPGETARDGSMCGQCKLQDFRVWMFTRETVLEGHAEASTTLRGDRHDAGGVCQGMEVLFVGGGNRTDETSIQEAYPEVPSLTCNLGQAPDGLVSRRRSTLVREVRHARFSLTVPTVCSRSHAL